jgi:hypothetical protein
MRDVAQRDQARHLFHADTGLRQQVRDRDGQVTAHRSERSEQEHEDDRVRGFHGQRGKWYRHRPLRVEEIE